MDEIVKGLVSLRPAPAPTSTEVPGGWADGFTSSTGRYSTPEVETSIKKLKDLGPAAFPYLIKHLEDDRYSYSDQPFISNSDGPGWSNNSVGSAVYLVLTNGITFAGGYKIREGPDGKDLIPLTITDFIAVRGGMKAWVEAVKDRSRAAVFTEFIDWCIAEEKKRGFKDKEDEDRIVSVYLKKRAEIETPGKK
ncbi:hypothetical protein OKA04_08895 [Luteolibacter flavescens]|uniref:Uncharacterized protein n=1 Tax=Luteolibacter flavescens TaxID=1859460 RepID=A0ABT3FMP3_9BACT|nr:hypothetical protein [Luteolibacter flavescens]MCW1884843.1 hypothetical protein [Luteolibacter flavescens]